ncbi:MAG TPA: type VII secretion protein EssC [Eubacterium sp.]|nr:type VII secretion protein EssC [Eubacterium sp.]
MVVNLISNARISGVTLPKKVKGQFWLFSREIDGTLRNLISIEGLQGKWHLKSNKDNYLVDSKGAIINEIELEDQGLYRAIVDGKQAFVFAHHLSDDRQIFHKYYVKNNIDISIGRTKDNDIIYDNKYVSSDHAKLSFYENNWVLSDNNSTNGTFVNDERISTVQLNPGDMIYIMGLRIIIGSDFVALNNPDECVTVKGSKMFPYEPQGVNPIDDEPNTELNNEFYYISPRFKRSITKKTFRIDPPPSSPVGESVPAILVVGPALTMGLASVTTAGFSVANAYMNGRDLITALPSVVMAGSMLLGMILWPTLNRKFENKRKRKAEAQREIAYRAYLQEVRETILREMGEQRDILNENNVPLEKCIETITKTMNNLWERSINQEDFLEIRLGIGEFPLEADIVCAERKFAVEYDHLLDEMYAVKNEPKILKNVPITFSVKDIKVSGIIGEDWDVVKIFVKNFIIRLTALHSYDELKLVFLLNEKDYETFKFVRWFPHVWDDDKSIRFVSVDTNEAKEVSANLEKIFNERITAKGKNLEKPYYVIFNFESKVNDKLDIVNDILTCKEDTYFSIVNVCDSVIKLPKECSVVIDVAETTARIYDKENLSGNRIVFKPDLDNDFDVEDVAIKEANTALDLSKQLFKLPSVYTFLDMFGVEKIEHLNPLVRWKDNNPCQSLSTPVGIDTDGEIFTLDLHERYQGPHGLVAGMTGSGKSEFIITFILSLAVNYHPDEVAFILIDYKGGGLTGAFEYKDKGIVLPHLTGTITNLDGAAIKRSLISIQSELRRRQAIFNEARKISNEGTMDIYRYQKLYREKIVSEPVPHLFIISDEFAELKAQQPEFMEQLISTARIGRSLGVHLILATQKPNGVVDDQIWSNTRFRVCLKVSEKADSNDMIKRPDAAELSNTGRFYLQVGFNELFALGQSAWCGAPYDENKKNSSREKGCVKVLDHIGRVVKEGKPAKKDDNSEKQPKQIVAVVKYLSELAKEENISVRQLWLDPIPDKVWISQLIEKYDYKDKDEYIIEPVIGELDDPSNQAQKILTLPISTLGNVIIYGVAGSGKMTFLTTMLCELIRTRSAKNINIYALDFGAETLKVFEKAPQVGGVVLSNEYERIINLLKMLKSEMENRKRLFSEFGGDYKSYVVNSGKTVPNILLVINNFTAFNEMYEECIDVLALLSREGIKYGIYLVITSNNANSVRYRIAQNFKQIYALQLNDKTDYTTVFSGGVDGIYPSNIKGRGIVKNDHTYEFQTAYISEEGNIRESIIRLCEDAKKRDNYSASEIPVLPRYVNREFFTNDVFTLENVPIGVESKTLHAVRINLLSSLVSFVAAQDAEKTSAFAQGLAEILSYRQYKVKVLDVNKSFAADDKKQYDYCESTDAEKYIVDFYNEMVNRFKKYKTSNNLDDAENVVYIINSLDAMKSIVSDDAFDKFNVTLEKISEKQKASVILCDSSMAFNKFSGVKWFRTYSESGQGVWIGDGVSTQYVLKIGKVTSALYQEVADGFGYYINKGRISSIKVLTSDYIREEE